MRTARSMPSMLASAASAATPSIISSAARQAHWAWSSRAMGAPNSAMMPSPVNLSTVPSAWWTASASTWKKRFISSRHDSGSSFSARSIDPCTSANSTVICLRSPSIDSRLASIFQATSSGIGSGACGERPTGVPHWLQNLDPGGTVSAHPEQTVSTASDSPQSPQNRDPSGFPRPQLRQTMPGPSFMR